MLTQGNRPAMHRGGRAKFRSVAPIPISGRVARVVARDAISAQSPAKAADCFQSFA